MRCGGNSCEALRYGSSAPRIYECPVDPDTKNNTTSLGALATASAQVIALGNNSKPRKAVEEVGLKLGAQAEEEVREVYCNTQYKIRTSSQDSLPAIHGIVTAFALQKKSDPANFGRFRNLIENCYSQMLRSPPTHVGETYDKGNEKCVDVTYHNADTVGGEVSYTMCLVDTEEGWRTTGVTQKPVGQTAPSTS